LRRWTESARHRWHFRNPCQSKLLHPARSFLACPSSLNHITGAGREGLGTLVADVHTFRGGSAVDAGNEHGRETGGAPLSLSGAAGDDHGA
jgi:hypothetical protein